MRYKEGTTETGRHRETQRNLWYYYKTVSHCVTLSPWFPHNPIPHTFFAIISIRGEFFKSYLFKS